MALTSGSSQTRIIETSLAVELKYLEGAKIIDKGKPPKTFEEGRKCSVCDRRLSVYNKGPNCWEHTEKKRPRLRGRGDAPINPPKCRSCANRAGSLFRKTGQAPLELILVDGMHHRPGLGGAATLCEESSVVRASYPDTLLGD